MFAITLPWSVIGFWNASIGFLIMRFAAQPDRRGVSRPPREMRGDEPITASTAIVIFIRNEVPARILRNLKPLMSNLVAAGLGDRFHVYVLSDTNDADIAATKRPTSRPSREPGRA